MLHVLAGTCPNLVRTLPALPYDKTRVEDVDTKAEDHACLVADTLVHTDRGLIPIEHVVVGDRALTREGYRQVSNAAMTDSAAEVGSVTFADGTVLIGQRTIRFLRHAV